MSNTTMRRGVEQVLDKGIAKGFTAYLSHRLQKRWVYDPGRLADTHGGFGVDLVQIARVCE